jgi:hypothetical protein
MTYFVIRAKAGLQFRRRLSRPIDKATGVRSDQTISLTGPKTSRLYPAPLRRVSYYSEEIDKRFVFLTNDFLLPPLTVAAIYRNRWQVELFFKWIKQHLRIKRFVGTSPNCVKTQIWIAVAVYVLIATIKKQLGLRHSLNTILQILSGPNHRAWRPAPLNTPSIGKQVIESAGAIFPRLYSMPNSRSLS